MKEKIEILLDNGFLLSPGLLASLPLNFDFDLFIKKSSDKLGKHKPVVINKDLFFMIESPKNMISLNWNEFENSRVLLEKGRDIKLYSSFLDMLKLKDDEKKVYELLKDVESDFSEVIGAVGCEESSVVVLSSYVEVTKKKEVQDFVEFFRVRYDDLKNILLNREELQNSISIKNVSKRGDRVSIIGLVADKQFTKNNNCILTLEDFSGSIKVLITNRNLELYNLAKDIVLDEVIGVLGTVGDDIVFSNKIIFPEVPLSKEFKKCDDDVYVAFTADTHVGSNMFFAKDFLRFIKWLNGETGNAKQRDMAKKVKYLFIIGDLIDGVGIYPNQSDELVIKDVYKQYEKCAEFLSKIRKDLKIIVCAGNHDALRLAEPQPILDKNLASPILDLPNVLLVTNPCLVNIHSSKDFPGFDVLLYHGYSFNYFADSVESIRMDGGMDRSDLIMKFLLQRRHLAPSHSSTLYIPNPKKDPLIIDKVPDFFATGHMHRTDVINYRNVTAIGCGCWQGKTSFMEKVGANPDPSRVNLVNLKTREVKILNFSK